MKLYINENQINLLKNTELSGKTKYYVNCGITDTLHPILEGVKHEEMDEYMIGGEGDANGFIHVIDENIDDEMKLYHGSVSDFDAFNLDFAHSGEGYEVYGFGVYATTIDETAHFYAKIANENSDIEVRFGGEEPHNASESIVASYLKETEGNIIKAIQNVWELNKLEDSDKAKEASNILLACYNKKDNGNFQNHLG